LQQAGFFKPEFWRILMRDLEAVLSDLEWRRVRRRVAMHPFVALLRNCGTTAMIVVLKLAAPVLAR
jgi:hypothetical protein